MINARIEGLEDKPAFRDSLRNQRCIVPASGYYEWQTLPDGRKQPYFVTLADGSPMAFAGLYATWAGPDGEEVDTAAIVTTPAGADTAHVHNRTPAILRGEAVEAWLDTGHVRAPQAAAMIAPLEAGAITLHPVGRAIGSATAEGPDLIVPVAADPATPRPRRRAAASGQLDLF
jgi:putative SOS response-associated peptidase YedK